MVNLKRSFLASNYFTWFLFRRMIIIVTLLYFLNNPLVQITIHLLLAVVDLVILLKARPFLQKVDQCFNILNSLFLLGLYIVVILMYNFSHIVKVKETLGWVMILAILSINGFNLLAITIVKLVEIVGKCKQKRRQREREIEAKYKLELARERNSASHSFFEKIYPVTSGAPLQHDSDFKEMDLRERRPDLRRVSKQSNELK